MGDAEQTGKFLLAVEKACRIDPWDLTLVEGACDLAELGGDFVHAATVMFLSKDGKIARYLNGTQFNPADLKLAVIDASEGRARSFMQKIQKLCYSYDPEGRAYVLQINRVILGLEFRHERDGDAPGRLVVAGVEPDSPAGKAGVREGEVVEALDDRPAATMADLYIHMLDKAVDINIVIT